MNRNNPARVPAQLLAALHARIVAIRMADLKAYVTGGSIKTEGTYNRQLWRVTRELFHHEIDEYQFIDDMSGFIDNQFTRAWNQGAREMAVNPNQMQAADLAELARLIEQERYYMLGLADAILGARDQPDATVAPFRARIDTWSNRYHEIVSQARMWFGGKIPLEWVVGPTEHCTDCERLNGIVATADQWRQSGHRPQSRALECGGWRCQCALESTDKPFTPGGIPL
jgi:hypothetical protein